ncbi:hypothetical protein Bbelb_443500 [Branchiostoma belcheri]|nr:hypothetical protein Bbelb_443500 [Branchiostoma belcheri]
MTFHFSKKPGQLEVIHLPVNTSVYQRAQPHISSSTGFVLGLTNTDGRKPNVEEEVGSMKGIPINFTLCKNRSVLDKGLSYYGRLSHTHIISYLLVSYRTVLGDPIQPTYGCFVTEMINMIYDKLELESFLIVPNTNQAAKPEIVGVLKCVGQVPTGTYSELEQISERMSRSRYQNTSSHFSGTETTRPQIATDGHVFKPLPFTTTVFRLAAERRPFASSQHYRGTSNPLMLWGSEGREIGITTFRLWSICGIDDCTGDFGEVHSNPSYEPEAYSRQAQGEYRK